MVRAVITRTNNEAAVAAGDDASKLTNTFFVHKDWIGELIVWDGDKFEMEFKIAS